MAGYTSKKKKKKKKKKIQLNFIFSNSQMGSSLKSKNLLPFEHIRCFNPLLTTETRERVIGIESHYVPKPESKTV